MTDTFLWKQARLFRRELALISTVGLLSSLAALSVPWLAGQLLGGMVSDFSPNLYGVTGLLILGLAVMAALNICAGLVSARTSGLILARIRTETYNHLQHLPNAFHDMSKRGDLLSLMTHDVRGLASFLTATLASIPSMLLTVIGASFLLLLVDPVMALVIPILIPLFFIVTRLVGRRLRTLAAEVRQAEAEVIWAAERDLELVPATKAFAREAPQSRHYAAVIDRARILSLREDRITTIISPLISFMCALIAICVVVFASSQSSGEARSPGDLFATLLYAALLTRPVGGLAGVYGQWQIARGTVARLERILSEPRERGYQGKSLKGRAQGSLSFEKVTFGYQGRDRVLHCVDFTIEPGQVVALTGVNGVGKSTIARLLMGFYAPQDGRVLLDNVDVRQIQVQELRRQFGYVPQRAQLFNGSIAQNIAFGCDNASPEAIANAVGIAQGTDFIERLPDGLGTEIGDNGVRLSGGQRQRIALARALLIDPPVLILDEATSMYDRASEAAFIAECADAFAGRTVLLITHRPATLALADRILEVSGGGVLEKALCQ